MTITHRLSHTRIYKIWKGMFTRCYNSQCRQYKDWGGRGIGVCARWHEFKAFYEDMSGTYFETASIDRIDNDGDYSKHNCRWATRVEQNRNKRMHKLTPTKVREIISRYQYGNGKDLAKEYGVTIAVISEIVNGKRNYASYHQKHSS